MKHTSGCINEGVSRENELNQEATFWMREVSRCSLGNPKEMKGGKGEVREQSQCLPAAQFSSALSSSHDCSNSLTTINLTSLKLFCPATGSQRWKKPTHWDSCTAALALLARVESSKGAWAVTQVFFLLGSTALCASCEELLWEHCSGCSYLGLSLSPSTGAQPASSFLLSSLKHHLTLISIQKSVSSAEGGDIASSAEWSPPPWVISAVLT